MITFTDLHFTGVEYSGIYADKYEVLAVEASPINNKEYLYLWILNENVADFTTYLSFKEEWGFPIIKKHDPKFKRLKLKDLLR